jgi:CheY-like chemotaxis protein
MKSDKAPIFDKDVYVLTAKGSGEIHGTATALSPAELELLICIDGRTPVSEIRRLRLTIPPAAVDEAFAGLLRKGLIELYNEKTSPALDISALLNSTGQFKLADMGMEALSDEAAAGTSSLKDKGYYVRIARRAAAKREMPKDRKLQALVVEDEPYLAKFLRTYLVLEGFEARIASNRQEIIDALRQPPVPDLVLLDVTLPDADGFNILQKIRQHPALRAVPIIMLTAQATREAVLKGLAGGADGYMTKPFEVENLIAGIRTVLGIEK